MDCSSPGSSVHAILQANTGMGYRALLQGVSLIQGLNLHVLRLLHWQTGSLPLAPPGKPKAQVQGPEKPTQVHTCVRIGVTSAP